MNIQGRERDDFEFEYGSSSLASKFTKPGSRRYWIGGAALLGVVLIGRVLLCCFSLLRLRTKADTLSLRLLRTGVSFVWAGRGPSVEPKNLPKQVLVPIPTTQLNSGYEIPLLGWGSFTLRGDKCRDATQSAVQAGYRVGNSQLSCTSFA